MRGRVYVLMPMSTKVKCPVHQIRGTTRTEHLALAVMPECGAQGPPFVTPTNVRSLSRPLGPRL